MGFGTERRISGLNAGELLHALAGKIPSKALHTYRNEVAKIPKNYPAIVDEMIRNPLQNWTFRGWLWLLLVHWFETLVPRLTSWWSIPGFHPVSRAQ